MKKALFAIFVILTVTLCSATDRASDNKGAAKTVDPVELAKKGDAAYQAKKYADAMDMYEQALKQMPSAVLWYNLGNAQYRAGAVGKAIVSYERALRLDPTMEGAKANLDFLNSRIVDRPGQRGSFLERKADNIANRNSSNGWAWIAFGWFLLAGVGVMVYMMGTNVMLRKVGFFGTGVLLLLCFVALFLSFRARSIALDNSIAIVTARSTILSTVPRQPSQQSEEAMMLHEGTKVEVLDSVGTSADSIWYDVRINNTQRAWINAASVTKVSPF